jgi:hypothetical protein
MLQPNPKERNVITLNGEAINLPEGVTPADIQRTTGLSKSTVSRVLAGKYPPGTDGHDKVMAAIAELSGPAHPEAAAVADAARPQAPMPPQTMPASYGQKLMAALLQTTVEDREFTILAGASGAGKTHVIGQFREEHPDALYLKPRKRMSVNDVLCKLCDLFGVSRSGSGGDRLERLIQAASGRLLIIDEADLLVAGRRPNQVENHIETFRELYEAGCTVILVGLPVLIEQITRCCETYVFSRPGYWMRIPDPTEKEMESFWLARTAGLSGAAAEAGRAARDAKRFGLFRYLDKLERRSRLLEGDVAAARTLLYHPEV